MESLSQREFELIDCFFGEIRPENDDQAFVMVRFANMFEEFLIDFESIITLCTYLSNLRDAAPVDSIFSPSVLKNTEMFSIIFKQLEGMKMKTDPVQRAKTRYPIKTAYAIYPGNQQQDLREKAEVITRKFVYDNRTSTPGASSSSSAPPAKTMLSKTEHDPISHAPTVPRPQSAMLPFKHIHHRRVAQTP